MRKAFSLPIFLIAFAVLILVAGSFAYFKFPQLFSSVKGISTSSKPVSAGISITLTSENGGWDMQQYVCSTKEECAKSLTGGKRWQVLSGGATGSHDVTVSPSSEWKEGSYLKFFVKPAWGSFSRSFSVKTDTPYSDVSMVTLSDQSGEYSAVLIPSRYVSEASGVHVIFSDK